MKDKIIINGKIPSKSNCYKIIRLGTHASLAKKQNLKDYEINFALQLKRQHKVNYDKPFILEANIYIPNKRQDLDNVSKILLDCMQSNNIIKNDNLCYRIELEKFIDKENPRVEFMIYEYK